MICDLCGRPATDDEPVIEAANPSAQRERRRATHRRHHQSCHDALLAYHEAEDRRHALELDQMIARLYH